MPPRGLPDTTTGSPYASRLSIPQLLSRRPQAHILLISDEEVQAILQHEDRLLGTRQIVQLNCADSLLVYTNVDSNFNIVAISAAGISALNQDLTPARACGRGRDVNSNAAISVATALVGFFAWREVWALLRTLKIPICVSTSLMKQAQVDPQESMVWVGSLGATSLGMHQFWSPVRPTPGSTPTGKPSLTDAPIDIQREITSPLLRCFQGLLSALGVKMGELGSLHNPTSHFLQL